MPDLKFEFLTDRAKNTITTVREFAAGRTMVWDCYSRSELLDRWFAPKPLTTKTSHMDFREGGYWHYAMFDQGGAEYWGRLDYLEIRPVDGFAALDGFCDASGTVNPDMPRSRWDVTLREAGRLCEVRTVVSYASTGDLETVIGMGVEAGITSTFERLDELLADLAG